MIAVRPATQNDLTEVLRLRLSLFAESGDAMSPSEAEAVRLANENFFREHMNSPSARTWVAEVDGSVASVGTLALFLRPPYPGNLLGKEAYLLNMFTAPKHRNQGLARAIVAEAMKFAEVQGCKKVWLHATEAGKPLYKYFGFQQANSYMESALP